MIVESAHVDAFAREHLPSRELWPEQRFTLPDLQYPERINAAAHLIDRHVLEGLGERRCVVGEGIAWSYDEVMRKANQIARVLVDDLGVVPGNRVLLRAFNSPMLAVCWLGVIKAGGIAVTTMPLYRAGELRYMIGKAQIHHALCDVRLADDLREATPGADVFHAMYFGDGSADSLETRMAGKSPTFRNVDTAADDIAIVGFTSGTTGQPKAAMHSHRDIMAVCDTFGTHVLCASADDLFCGSPPVGFAYGIGGLLLFPWSVGAATLLLEKPSADVLVRGIAQHRASVVFTAPIAYRAMLPLLEQHDTSSLRICVSAGETLPSSTAKAWREKTGVAIIDGIGSTEMLHIFIASPVERIKLGSTGQVVPGYVAEIHDDAGNALPPDTVGRLAVKGPTGCRYLDDERQRTYVQHGWNYPGDAYRMDTEGYFWYVARTDDMIVSAGYNISGPEVEEALLAHESVRECAVVAKPDPVRHTNIVKAYVVLTDAAGKADATEESLQEFVRSRIASFKCPREIEFVAELPRTQTGKVQRFRLREKAATE